MSKRSARACPNMWVNLLVVVPSVSATRSVHRTRHALTRNVVIPVQVSAAPMPSVVSIIMLRFAVACAAIRAMPSHVAIQCRHVRHYSARSLLLLMTLRPTFLQLRLPLFEMSTRILVYPRRVANLPIVAITRVRPSAPASPTTLAARPIAAPSAASTPTAPPTWPASSNVAVIPAQAPVASMRSVWS